jgi:transcriptional regulator with XRE-family HTH domain
MDLSHIIRRVRKSKGMTLEEVALAAKTTASNLSRIELGRHAYSPDMLDNIAEALGVTVANLYELAQYENSNKESDLFDPEAFAPPKLTKRHQKLLDGYETLDEYGKEAIDALLATLIRQQRRQG